MSVFTLQPMKHLAVAYTAPFVGSARYYVESEHPITILALDDANLAFWREGKPSNRIGGASGVYTHQQEMAAETFGDPFAHFNLKAALGIAAGGTRRWHLVMVNFHPTQPTAVYYNVQG